jgi:hypothetical protein
MWNVYLLGGIMVDFRVDFNPFWSTWSYIAYFLAAILLFCIYLPF